MKTITTDRIAQTLILFFTILTGLWVFINFFQEPESIFHDVFTVTYGLVALGGGLAGLFTATKWGGFRSLMGKAIIFLSLGLLFQEFGQLAYSYYIYVLGIEVPYPSIGDIGFLGYVPMYLLGMMYVGQLAGVKVSLKSTGAKMFAFLTPILFLVFSGWFFLNGYVFDWEYPLITFLDLAYPLGQALNISIMIVVFVLSNKILGGIMKARLWFIGFAYFMQYVADFSFLYQVNRDLWQVSGTSDYMYLVAYFLMSLALLELKTTFNDLYNKE